MYNINILKKGDEILSINSHFLAIKRKNGEADIYNVFFNEDGFCIDPVKTATIGYGNGTVEKTLDDGETKLIEF